MNKPHLYENQIPVLVGDVCKNVIGTPFEVVSLTWERDGTPVMVLRQGGSSCISSIRPDKFTLLYRVKDKSKTDETKREEKKIRFREFL